MKKPAKKTPQARAVVAAKPPIYKDPWPPKPRPPKTPPPVVPIANPLTPPDNIA